MFRRLRYAMSGQMLRDLEAVQESVEARAKVLQGGDLAAVTAVLEQLLQTMPGDTPEPLRKMVVSHAAQHQETPLLIAALRAGVPVWLWGDAGSGKTTAAERAAEALGLPFRFISVCPTTSESKLLGYKDAMGVYQTTAFREVFEHGGLFLIDEIDNGNPSILTVLNTALANGYCSFPDGNVARHKDARFVAAANTIGRGADVRYIGRNMLDATTLDRFVFIRMDIDPNLEGAMVGRSFDRSRLADVSAGGSISAQDWHDRVLAVRKACADLGIEHLVTPRATVYGARLIAQGVGRTHLDEMCLWKGIRATDKTKILNNLQ